MYFLLWTEAQTNKEKKTKSWFLAFHKTRIGWIRGRGWTLLVMLSKLRIIIFSLFFIHRIGIFCISKWKDEVFFVIVAKSFLVFFFSLCITHNVWNSRIMSQMGVWFWFDYIFFSLSAIVFLAVVWYSSKMWKILLLFWCVCSDEETMIFFFGS